jgi:O-antigen ligase
MNAVGIRDFYKSLNSNDWCLIFILVFSILYPPIVPLGFLAWVISIFRYKTEKTYSFWMSMECLFVCYYLLLLIGMVWTQDVEAGFFKLENKLSFLLFPLLFYFSKFSLSRSSILNILLFSAGLSLLIYEFIAIFKSIYYPENNNWGYFKDVLFSPFMHRGYYAFYLVIGSLICHYKIYQNVKKTNLIVLFLFLSCGVFQTLSKAGILTWLIFNLILLLHFIIKRGSWKLMLTLGMGIVISVFVFLNIDSSIKNRFNKVPLSLAGIELKNNNSEESNQARILMWNASILSLSKGHFFGFGTGDDISILKAQNIRDHNKVVAIKELNAHNQFFTTALQIGLPGLLVLLAIFIKTWRNFFRDKHLLSLLISLCFFCNFFIESFLERQAGIILFCLLTITLSKEIIADKRETFAEN